MLEVGVVVGLVEDFDSEDGLDDVFESHESDGGSEFVGDEHDMMTLGDETLEEGIDRSVLGGDGDG